MLKTGMLCQLKMVDIGLFPIEKLQCENVFIYSFFSIDKHVDILAAQYHLQINCGGEDVIINDVLFEGDIDKFNPSEFVSSKTNWLGSNTGMFLDNERKNDELVAVNSSALSMINSKLYETARVSPVSLTYYMYCMAIGNYTISLHFAEIMFTNDKSYRSLGRRLFDVYVQVNNDILIPPKR